MNSTVILENILGWGLILGSLVSYTPQYYKIYNLKNTVGISETMIIAGVLSAYTNLLGSIQQDLQTLYACRGIDCYHIFLPIIQMISSYICFFVFYMFFLYFFKIKEILTIYQPNDNIYPKKRARLRGMITILITIILFIYFVIINQTSYHAINKSGILLNLISAILSLIMWIPQINTTYTLKNNHSLSLLALSFHSFGCLVTIIYQKIFANQSVWIILCYIVSFISELIILVLSLYYKYRNQFYVDMK